MALAHYWPSPCPSSPVTTHERHFRPATNSGQNGTLRVCHLTLEGLESRLFRLKNGCIRFQANGTMKTIQRDKTILGNDPTSSTIPNLPCSPVFLTASVLWQVCKIITNPKLMLRKCLPSHAPLCILVSNGGTMNYPYAR